MRERWFGRRAMAPLVVLLSVALTGCGLFDRLACIGDPAGLSATMDPDALTLEPGASGSVEVTVSGLSVRCFPRATWVGLADLPDGVAVEPVIATAQEPVATLQIVVAEEAVPGTYLLGAWLSSYHHAPVDVTLEVVAPRP
jgi:hypothetical protein